VGQAIGVYAANGARLTNRADAMIVAEGVLETTAVHLSQRGEVINAGVIEARSLTAGDLSYGIRLGYFATEFATIVNSGIIRADVAITASLITPNPFVTGGVSIRNDVGGLIAGAIQLVGGDNVIDNAGTIAGRVTTGTGADRVTNGATIAGTIALGGGADRYDGRAATSSARVDGEDGDDVLIGGTGADVLSGGDGDDRIDGGAGDDVLTGGAGRDRFVFGVGMQGADRITDFTYGSDVIDLDGHAFTAIAMTGSTTILTYERGTLSLENVAQRSLSDWNGQVAGLVPVPTDQFVLIANGGVQASVQGTGRVAAGSVGVQEITVRDVAGTIGFGATFNEGGDRVKLSGAASAWTVSRSGSTVTLSDGDTNVLIPVGTVGSDLIFADGIRTLRIDSLAAAVKLGSQIVTSSVETVVAPPGPATATAPTDANLPAQMLLLGAGPVTVVGPMNIAGSAAIAETVIVSPGAKATFGASFSAGGDTIVLPGTLANYQVYRSGSTAIFGGGETTVALPISVAGTVMRFGDGAEARLFIDQVAGAVKLGDMIVGTKPVVLAFLDASTVVDPVGGVDVTGLAAVTEHPLGFAV
jgi:hypothetical protein